MLVVEGECIVGRVTLRAPRWRLLAGEVLVGERIERQRAMEHLGRS